MELGIDSFATADLVGDLDSLRNLVARIEHAVDLDAFGIGEHHRHEFLDSAPARPAKPTMSRTRSSKTRSA